MDQVTIFQIEPKKCNIDELTPDQRKELEQVKPHCELITLKGNSYSKQFFGSFLEDLKQMPKLIRVNANDIFVGRGKEEIPESLSLLGTGLIGKSIISIDLSNNAVNPFGADALKPFLKQASELRIFLINNCGLGIDGVTHIAQGLGEGAHNLEIFAIARNRAENEGASQIALNLVTLRVFDMNNLFVQNLKELHIYQNGIKQKGMIPLLQSLKENCPNLELLDIRDNFVHKETTTYLCDLITSNKCLKALNISDCNIESSQNNAILEAIEKSELKFEKLGYNYGELNDQQGKMLCNIVENRLNYFQKLELKGNEFKKATKTRFQELFKEKAKALGAFESDDEQDVDELAREFSTLKI